MAVSDESFSKAISYFRDSKELAEQIRLMAVHQESLKQLSDTYTLLKDYETALAYYKEYTSLNESISKEQANNKISIMQLGYHLKEQAQKQTIREVDLSMKVLKERNIRNIVIFITILAISIVFILWSRYKLKLKTNRELRQMNADLEKRMDQQESFVRRYRGSTGCRDGTAGHCPGPGLW